MSSSVANLPWLPPISGPNFKHTLAHQLGASAEPAVQNVAAHVYRFLHRAFVHWPVGQSAEQLDAVVDLWLAVAFPWTGVDRAKCGRRPHASTCKRSRLDGHALLVLGCMARRHPLQFSHEAYT